MLSPAIKHRFLGYRRAFPSLCTLTCVSLAICLLLPDISAACPTCKEGIAQNDPAQQAMAAGYFYSILFMITMPFAILGTFGSFAYFSIRKARQQQQADMPTEL